MATYFGTYEKFNTVSKNDAGILLGRDNCVGDIYSIECELVDGEHKAWLISRFDQKIGFFSPKFSRKISLLLADNLKVKAILSVVAFTDNSEEGFYWGEMAIIAYNPAYETEFTNFINNVSLKLADGVRPKLGLGAEGESKVISTNGEYVPNQNMPAFKKEKGTAILKDHRSAADKLVEEGRKGNKGCYIISWAFLLAIVAIIVYFILSVF
jgi:hypothetical protein